MATWVELWFTSSTVQVLRWRLQQHAPVVDSSSPDSGSPDSGSPDFFPSLSYQHKPKKLHPPNLQVFYYHVFLTICNVIHFILTMNVSVHIAWLC